MNLTGKNIAVYVTGGIASYKAASFVRLLITSGATVKVAMTESACQFITPMTFQVLTKQEVYTDTFDDTHPDKVNHIYLADWSDIAIVIPATGNTIAKIANGIADNFVTSALLATDCLRIIAPAMNQKMLLNPATQRNIKQLQADGWQVIDSSFGFLAEGYNGLGRLPEPEELFEQTLFFALQKQFGTPLSGKKIVISAGGTKERIDPVRYISNDSSGKMGYALARAASILGAKVILISTVTNLPIPHGVKHHLVETAQELQSIITQNFKEADIVIMAAAVSDFRVDHPAKQKIKKEANTNQLTLSLIKNQDILAYLGEHKTKEQLIVGFAAETNDVMKHATSKLTRKKADIIIANDVSDQSIGFNSNENKVTMLYANGEKIHFQQQSKESLALKIMLQIVKY
ncbi:phosphopantothenoylcysteine decarboxylase / phosphopantothenate--cysteine ligase [Granulicatella balaenopterae]|uniref:Coenzyme A biosynthesis bifunctional protein CoaBC n=1 Tax=Granulicatella balaenopterae TaxID=137733 RepID=A0A1H9KKZ6_9LACT|nr:bifunctional phosphopantothenoylcysteine decarboxylase/phosphopantothenate--cysteine ligase CoaBC [Granulicatella balaenopterae]SEQ99739.1 phosphopantothenoylcysteine decarboxylase / phosphopantothenate--cysteine ligase [Granulicatella balaenopterae]